MLFRVPPAWQKVLYGKSIGPQPESTGAIGAALGKGASRIRPRRDRRASPWRQWLVLPMGGGQEPEDIPVPDLPEWMLKGMILDHSNKAAESNSGGGVDYDERMGPTGLRTLARQRSCCA